MAMNDDLKNAIKKGSSLQKVPDDELKRRDEERRKRMEELKILSEKLL